MATRLSLHILRYGASTVLVTLASVVSFPLLTRLLSVADYGLLSLLGAVGTVLVAFGKAGLQHAVPRFHAEVEAGKQTIDGGAYTSTVVFGMVGIGLAVTALAALAAISLPLGWLGLEGLRSVLLLSLLLVPLRVLDSALSNLLQARQHSGLLSSYGVARRYATVGLTLGAIAWIAPSVGPYYLATLLAEGVAVAVLLHHFMRRETLRPAHLSVPVLRQMLAYGLPMLAFELSGITLYLGDRFVIEAFLGVTALGVYSAAYGLCGMASSVLVESYQRAITPTAMRLWETQGAPEAGHFIGRMLHIYLIGATAVMAVSASLGGDLLTLLASEKYREGAAVVPWVMAGVLIGGLMPFVGAGLYMVKRTRALMGLLMMGAVVNMALNVALIPAIGLVGAAVATFGANVVMAVCAARVGRAALPVSVDWSAVMRLAIIGTGACAIMAAGWHPVGIGVLDLALTIALGCALIAAAVLWLDPIGRTFRPTPRKPGGVAREPTRP